MSYSILPTHFNYADELSSRKQAVISTIEIMNSYDATDEVQLRNLAQKVHELGALITKANEELESLKGYVVCGRSSQRCRRYSLTAAETFIFLAGITAIVVDYLQEGTALTALKITGGSLTVLAKFVSNVTTICVGNSDENTSKREQELLEVVKNESFLRLASHALEECRQAHWGLVNLDEQQAVTDKKIAKADAALQSLAKSEVDQEPQALNFSDFAQKVRAKRA